MNTGSSSAKGTPQSNLLGGSWTYESLREVVARHPARPLLPPLGSAEWRLAARKPFAQKLVAPLRALAEPEWDEPLPILTDALYAEFALTGVRINFERVYFERRRRLARAAICLLMAEDGDPWKPRFASSFQEKFQDVFEEVSWALPASVHWDTDDRSGKDPLEIDLFCAETANLMAEGLDVFGAVLPQDLQACVRERLQRAVFENFLSRSFSWQNKTSNWNAVCHQGILGAALSQVNDADQLAAILLRAREKLPRFLEGYGPDGGCSEGPAYWDYGFGWFAVLNAQLEKRTEGELSLFEGNPLVRSIARYGPLVSLSKGMMVNFADGFPSGGLDPALLTYLGERLDEPSCTAAAAENFRRLDRDGVAISSVRTDFFHLSRWMLVCPEEPPRGMFSAPDCYFPDLGVLVARGTDAQGRLWEFAAKGGHNAEHHNHNDCGSFLLNVDGRRRLVEIGAPEYERDFFLPAKRYEFLAARSLGHSVPLVNGCEQRSGAEFAARILRAEYGGERVEFAVELSGCYPVEAKCQRLQRTFVWEKSAGRLTVTDEYELDEPGAMESILICLERPVLRGDDVSVAGVRVQPAENTRFVGCEVCTYRDHAGKDAQVYRLRFRPERESASGRLELVLSGDEG
jgi:hypothetical protein